jgi:predicted PurR-regulated permease PerM
MTVSSERAQSRLLALATIIAVVSVLYFAREVLIPLAMAILVSFLLSPIVSRLQRWGLNRVPAVLTAVATATALVFVVVGIFIYQMMDLVQQLPAYKVNIVRKIETLQNSYSPWFRRASATLDDLNSKLDADKKNTSEEAADPREPDSGKSNLGNFFDETGLQSTDKTQKPVPVSVVSGPTSIPDILSSYVGPVLAPFGTAAVIAVLAIFILIEREDLRNRFIRLIGDRQLHQTTDALDDASTRVSRYLLMQLIVNVTFGISVSIGLWLIDMRNVAVWGLLATVLRFIPYIGPWIAAAMPILLSLAIFEGWLQPLLVIGLFVVLELLSNNVMEPMLYGSSTGISAFGIIISAVFWTWLWQGVGLVLATPLTVCLMVLGRHVPQFRYLEILLGDQPPLPFSASVYQRLLALDEDEVANTAKKYLREHSLGELFDEVFVPALQYANQDHQQGKLDEARWHYVHDALRELIVDLQEEAEAAAAKAKLAAEQSATEATSVEKSDDAPVPPETLEKPAGKILCLAARDISDELAGQMLAVLLLAEGYSVEMLAPREPAGREATKESATRESVAEQPRMIWISALPPLADARARELCRQWTQRHPRAVINAGLWRETLHSRNITLLQRAGARDIAKSLREAVTFTNQFLCPAKIEPPAIEAANTIPMPTSTPVAEKPSAIAG